ncbi:MAG: sirohydrochlorin nickelochelatase [Methanothrix sp.]|jgi:sirohydrochlorin cobaltochelatase|nr:sirohydrochlorin nickelochelatase [Methanothrix sp.]
MADSMKDTGILVLGHGSRLQYNKELIESMASMIRDVHPGPVRTAYLNMNEPDIKAGLQSFSGTKIKKIVALPVFLASGVHVSKDIPRELGMNGTKKAVLSQDGEKIDILLAEPLGADECIANLAYRRFIACCEHVQG